MKIVRILGLVALLAWSSRPALGQLKYFGYVLGAETPEDLAATSPFTNTASTVGKVTVQQGTIVPVSLVGTVVAMRSVGVVALIDLGEVLWLYNPGPYSGVCPQTPNALYCLAPDYVNRWNVWRSANAAVLTPDYVVAFKVIDEPVHNGIPTQDVHAAATLVKNTYPSIKTVVIEAVGPTAPYFANSAALDWVGLDFFGYGLNFHPTSDPRFGTDMASLKAQMLPGQKIAYVMEAIWNDCCGHLPADAGPIAQEWYQVAAADPLAVALYPFLWAAPGFGSTVTSRDLPQSVRDEHRIIGEEITRPRTQNLVFNPSFERGITSGWALWAFGGAAASMQASASPHSGYTAPQVTVTTAGDVDLLTSPGPSATDPENKAIAVTPGTRYTFSAYIRSAGGATGGLRLIEQNAAGVPIRDNFLASGGGNGSWQQLTSELTMDTNTRYVSLRLLHWTTGVFTWDDVFFGTSNTTPNSSFELVRDTDVNKVEHWTLYVAGGAGTTAVSATARTGARAAQVTVTVPGSVDLATEAIPVFPGNKYAYSAYLLSFNGAQAGLRLIEFNAVGTAVRDSFLGNGGGSGTWALLAGSLTMTASTRFASLHLVHHIAPGTFLWDDVFFASTNLADDPSFELGTGSALTRWGFGSGGYGQSSLSVSATARSGSRAAQVVVYFPGDVYLTSSEGISTKIPVTPNTAYTYSAYLLSSGGAQAGLRIIEWSDTGQVLKDNFLANGGGTGSWQQLVSGLTTTSTTRFVTLRLVHHLVAGTFTWDDVDFTKN